MRRATFSCLVVFISLLRNLAAGTKPLRPIILPMPCDVIQIKAVESNAYLGVHRSPLGGYEITANHDYASLNTHFVVEYVRDADGPMVLRTMPARTHQRQIMVGFDSSGAVAARARTTNDLRERPYNTSLWLGGWPVYRHRDTLFAGAFHRLYLLGDSHPHNPIGLVGASQSGQISVYSMDHADRPGTTFIRPPTLFFVNIVSSPGSSACMGSPIS